MIVFKLPNTDEIYTLDQKYQDDPLSFYDFECNKAVQFHGKQTMVSEDFVRNINFHLPDNPEFIMDNESKEAYIKRIEIAKELISDHHLKKIVVARKKTVGFQNLNFSTSFLNLCKLYPSAFVYAFCEERIAWMGAFSEVLSKYNKNTAEFETMSLAGTLPVDEAWSDKEFLEQQPVSDYIQNVLSQYSDEVYSSKTYDHISGNIKHLRTDFKAIINAAVVDEVIKKLHPTPAVCGFPKEICQKLIHQVEDFSRELYAGYSRLEMADAIHCFVSLRCGRFYKNYAELYAGGGITALSNPDKEWRETELKLQALGGSLSLS